MYKSQFFYNNQWIDLCNWGTLTNANVSYVNTYKVLLCPVRIIKVDMTILVERN